MNNIKLIKTILISILVFTPLIITILTSQYGCYGYEINNNCLGYKKNSSYTDWYSWCKTGIIIGEGCLGYNNYSVGTGCFGLNIGNICIGIHHPMPLQPMIY